MKPQPVERRNTIGAPMNVQRNRNFSIGNFTAVSGNTPAPCVISMDNQMVPAMPKDHRKLDRSYSEPCDRLSNNNTNLNQAQKPAVNSSRYKTELCRPFEESGHCKYADKCQFAHGHHELKNLQRHPKYKTELCRTFHTKGFCPYGPRCNFVHNEALMNLNKANRLQQAQQQQQQQQVPASAPQPTQYFQHISPPTLSQSPPPSIQRPTSINFNCSLNGSMGSTTDSSPPSSVGSESPSLSPVFFGEDVNLNSCCSLPGNNAPLNYDSSNNSVFTNLSELASMDLPPLNIQTHHLNDADMGLIQQFNALLNLNNNSNNKLSAFEEWDTSSVSVAGGAPLSSPDSISGESVGSTNSCSSSGSFSSCESPAAADGRTFRLPVFNHISKD